MTILIVLHIFVTIALIGVILLQRSEGGGLGMGSAGGSKSMFTARGAANLLTRATAVLATLFIGMCILMAVVSKNQIQKASNILDEAPISSQKK